MGTNVTVEYVDDDTFPGFDEDEFILAIDRRLDVMDKELTTIEEQSLDKASIDNLIRRIKSLEGLADKISIDFKDIIKEDYSKIREIKNMWNHVLQMRKVMLERLPIGIDNKFENI